MIPTREIKARTKRAVTAAVVAGRELGLDVHKPVVLHNMFSVVVNLAPSPVAVRVPVIIGPGLPDEQLAARQQRELDVVAWLAGRDFPVVAPSPLVPRVPVARDGFSMTFWELADVAADHVVYGAVDSALVAELHSALRDYPAVTDLPFLAPVNRSVPPLLQTLATTPGLISPSGLDRALREWEILEPVLGSRAGFEKRFPAACPQAVHGDSPSYNVIRTKSGIRFADFEDVNLGPIEWDLALHTPMAVESYDRESSRRRARSVDPEILGVMNAARMLQMVGSVALIPQLPLLAKALKPSLEAWRGMPFAGGLG
jgi:hypothetical protein